MSGTMGFWDKLGDIWKDTFSWKPVSQQISNWSSDLGGMGRSLTGGFYNTIGSLIHTDSDQLSAGMHNFLDFGKSVWHTATDVPVLGQLTQNTGTMLEHAGESLAYGQNELIKRPVGALGLVLGDVTDKGSTLGSDPNKVDVGNLDTWKQAYNDTERVSAGQSLLWAAAQDPFTHRSIYNTPDPRTPEGQAFYHAGTPSNGAGGNPKLLSGAVDTALWFVDPFSELGAAGKAAKLRYISKPMDAAAVSRGLPDTYLQSKQATDLYQFYRGGAKTQDQALQQVFNKVPNGGTANGILWDAARNIDDEERSRDVFNSALRAMWGDNTANDQLVQAAPEMARSLLQRKAAGRMGQVARSAESTDPAVQAVLNARRETDAQSLVNAAAQGRGIYGNAYGILAGQNVPRLSLTSKWRVGMHQIFNGDAPIFFGDPTNPTSMASAFQSSRFMLPSSTFTKVFDFNDPNMAHLLRSNLESAKSLSPDRVADLTTQYARASTPESRFRIFNQAENEVFGAVASKYGYTRDQVNQTLPLLNQLRGGNRASFTNSRRFMSTDVRQLAKHLLSNGDEQGAAKAEQLGDDIDAAVKRGDQPTSVIVHYDMDGNPIIMPENFDPGAHPLMPSQTADLAAAMNWNVLDQALRWNSKGPLGQKAYTVYDRASNLADAVNQYWKVGVLLRLGMAWRASSDETLRTISQVGAAPVLQAGVDGLVRGAQNLYTRGNKLLADKVNIDRTRRGADTHDVLDDAVEEAATPAQPLSRQTTFNDQDVQHYDTYERALADGTLGVPAFLDAVKYHAENTPGALPDDLARMVQAHQDGLLNDREFEHEAVEHALHQHGRDVYASPTWQQAFIDQAVNNHASRVAGEDARPVVVDPFSGQFPPNQTFDGYTLKKTQTLEPGHEQEHLDGWLRDNADELLKPGHVLTGVVSRSGRIRVGVGRTLEDAEIKPTSGVRLAGDKFASRLTPGASGTVINTPAGAIKIEGAFEGTQGARLKTQTSAAGGQGKSWMDRVSDRKYAELSNMTRDAWEDVNPTQAGYKQAWSRAVNVQLANDPVARQFMQGRSVDDVLQWMYHTKAGRAYHERLGAWQGRAVEQVHSVQKMVDMYLPHDGSGAATIMRRKAMAGKADHDADLAKVVPDQDMRPTVHGGSLDLATGMTTKYAIDKALGKVFGYLQDKPADMMARFPFAAARYNEHAEQVANTIGAQFAKNGEALPANIVQRVQDIARNRTLADVRKYQYDATTTHDLARMARIVVPFGNAAMDSYQKWGTIFREKPWTAYKLWKTWTAPDRAGLVQDDNGYHLEYVDGKPRWFAVNPQTGARTMQPESYEPKTKYILFQPPSWINPNTIPGAKLTVSIPKNTLNTFLSLPTAGPVVGIPASNFAMSHPEFADNKFVKDFILPIGPQPASKQLIPGYVRSFYDLFNQQDGDAASQQALAIWETEMVQHSLGQRTTAPTYAEAREKANQLRGLRFMYQFAGLTPQFNTPYAPYVDAYRQMKANAPAMEAKDPNYNVDTDFYNQFGPEFFYLTAAVTRNKLGIPATIGGQKAYQKYQDLIDKNPDIANLIIGREGAGAFSQAVYENQLQSPVGPGSGDKMRARLSLEDSIDDVQTRLGWTKWNKMMDAIDADLADRGLADINAKGAEDLKDARNRFIQNNMWWNDSPTGVRQIDPWYKDYMSRDASKVTARLGSLSNIVTDPRLSQRDDIQGLSNYLSARQQMAQIMRDNNVKTLNSKKATPYREMWFGYVQGLKQSNLSFASLYNRWLIGDQYLDAPFTPAKK